MLVSYFDASADEEYTVVCGWVATLESWERFDANWRLVLAHYDVPYFHMKEFAHSRGVFEGWKGKDGTRQNFLKDLISVLASHRPYRIGCVLGRSVLAAANRTYKISEYYHYPYVLCALACMEFATRYRDMELPGRTIEYVFERGDLGQGRIVDICNERNAAVPSFKRSRDHNGERGVVQLQAADFAAWELHDAAKDVGSDHPFYEYRKSFMALVGLRGEWKEYTQENLVDGSVEQGIGRRCLLDQVAKR